MKMVKSNSMTELKIIVVTEITSRHLLTSCCVELTGRWSLSTGKANFKTCENIVRGLKSICILWYFPVPSGGLDWSLCQANSALYLTLLL